MKKAKQLFTAALLLGLTTALPFAAAAADAPSPERAAEITAALSQAGGAVFPLGADNAAYAQYFTGQSYLAPIGADKNVRAANVTFAPSCINHWHYHTGSCQILMGVSGRGYYQIWGEEPVEMKPGDSVTIPEGVKHWHGAAPDSWFQHIAVSAANMGTTWLEPVDEAVYKKLK